MLTALVSEEQLLWQQEEGVQYFTRAPAKLTKTAKINFRDTFGNNREMKNVFILENPEFIREMASGYLAVEITPSCNVACGTCFNYSNLRQADKVGAPFMEEEFARPLANLLGVTPYEAKGRLVTISGGEPTLNAQRAAIIAELFANASKNNHLTIATNGISIPVEQYDLENTLKSFDQRVKFQLSYNTPLVQQYLRFKGRMDEKYQVPDTEDPLLSKIEIIYNAAKAAKRNVIVRVTEFQNESGVLSEKVRRVVGNDYYSEELWAIGQAAKNKFARPNDTSIPKSLDRLYIQANGTLSPRYHHVGLGPGIGTLGFVTDIIYN